MSSRLYEVTVIAHADDGRRFTVDGTVVAVIGTWESQGTSYVKLLVQKDWQ